MSLIISALTKYDSSLSTSLWTRFTVDPTLTDWLEEIKSTKPILIKSDPIPEEVNLFLINLIS